MWMRIKWGIIEYLSFYTCMYEWQVWGRVVLGWMDISVEKRVHGGNTFSGIRVSVCRRIVCEQTHEYVFVYSWILSRCQGCIMACNDYDDNAKMWWQYSLYTHLWSVCLRNTMKSFIRHSCNQHLPISGIFFSHTVLQSVNHYFYIYEGIVSGLFSLWIPGCVHSVCGWIPFFVL